MGKGIALQMKNAFSENFKIYSDAVKRGEIRTGQVQAVPFSTLSGVRYIVNFPTKNHWRYPSKNEWIREGLRDLRKKILDTPIDSSAIPALGCGNGGLEWMAVKEEIESVLHDLPADIQVYEPTAEIKELLAKQEKLAAVRLTPARVILLFFTLPVPGNGSTRQRVCG